MNELLSTHEQVDKRKKIIVAFMRQVKESQKLSFAPEGYFAQSRRHPVFHALQLIPTLNFVVQRKTGSELANYVMVMLTMAGIFVGESLRVSHEASRCAPIISADSSLTHHCWRFNELSQFQLAE